MGPESNLSRGTQGAKCWSGAGGLHRLAFEMQVARYISEEIKDMICIWIGTGGNKLDHKLTDHWSWLFT